MNVHGPGQVTSNPPGLDCTNNAVSGTTTCTATFNDGESVDLTATPVDGADYSAFFLEWQGACTGSGGCSLTMDSDKSVDAQFGALGTPVVAFPLSVTVNGSGTVTSSPAGISCTNSGLSGNNTCTASFVGGTMVTLTATPVDGADYTSFFVGWQGACSGNSTTCVVAMNSVQDVTAQFGALGTPIFAWPVPDGQDIYNYLPVETPYLDPDPGASKPFAVGDVAGGTLSMRVAMPVMLDPVDVYLALYAPDVNPDIWVFTPGPGMQSLNDGLVAWKEGTTGGFDETLFGDIPVNMLPSGTYNIYMVVTPQGSTDTWYFYSTYFVIP